MSELMWYLSFSGLTLLLFAWWFSRQGKADERSWLLQQIQAGNDDAVAALQKLDQQNSQTGRMTVLMALLILPATFMIDYLWFHEVPIEQRISVSEATQNAPDLQTAIKQLEAKLAEDPNDLEGQMLYARSMMRLQRFAAAVSAYRQAAKLAPDDAHVLTELAEAIAFNNNTGSFLGEPESHIQRALQLQPDHQKAMWLQGIIYFEHQQYQQAEDIWTSLLPRVGSSNVAETITRQINQAREALNKPPLTPALNEPVAQQPLFDVLVDASDAVKAMDFSPDSRLFVFAREPGGPPMPVAAVPVSAPFDWPILVTLTDRNSLNPQRKLSQFEQLTLEAKLSLSGSATPDASDLSSAQVTTDPAQSSIQLTINK
jgi:cytochrome c-type biogenesis protein CcmH